MKRYSQLLAAVVVALILSLPLVANSQSDIAGTKHNLSMSGPGELRSLTETRICIFCHTPHNAAPRTPLWNKEIVEGNVYVPYDSSTMGALVSQPSGPSRLCLSCHDGTLALGAVLRPAGGIEVTGQITPGRPSYIGTNLSAHHPVSFSYYDSLPNSELEPLLPEGLLFYGAGFIHCSTCHNAHDNHYGKFLVADNSYSRLCTKCHIKAAWNFSTHRTSVSILPVPLPGKAWTGWSNVAEYGCEGCHTPHSAGGPKRILYNLKEEENCYRCHDGTVALKNIKAQFQNKPSVHPVEATTGTHDPAETRLSPFVAGHVECVDCHNPHAVNNRTAVPPFISGMLDMVAGVDSNGLAATPAKYEYEICFRCHSDMTSQLPFVPRVVDSTNARVAFSLGNPSYHPVVGVGANLSIPSIPSALNPALSASSTIYCSDCHSDDGGLSRGPHGSVYAPILKERYETMDGTLENFQNYALCYRCHERDSILRDDSFRKSSLSNKGGHSGHLAAGSPCSACHDPHGIRDDGATGNHTNLINFDTRTVTPAAGNIYPFFTDLGSFRGSCTLVCHGKTHLNASYP
ncbi:MAG: cytochrome c3 family protein [Thermodesulfovibrionales bacterium]